MKKILIALTIIMFSTSFIIAGQIQIRPMVGYGFGVHQRETGTEQVIDTSGVTTKNENIYYSGGAGLNFGLGILIGLTENLGVELGGGYVLGSEKEVYKETDNSTSPVTTEVYKNKSSYIPIDITLKIKGKSDQIIPYIGFGPTIAVGGKIITTYSMEQGSNTAEKEWETTFNTGFGWNAVLGADYKINDSISLSLALALHTVGLKAEKQKMTKYTVNGKDVLGTLTTRDKETEYKEDDSSDDPTNPNAPAIDRTSVTSFSSLDIKLGVAIGF